MTAPRSTPRIRVCLVRGEGADAMTTEIEVVGVPYSPDVFADVCRHAVTSFGALYPEDDDQDLLDDLNAQYEGAPDGSG